MFNVLAARMDWAGMQVLDLYAGSGALGLEALSRGAASALFIESSRRAADVITRNIATLGLADATLRRGAVTTVLATDAARPVDLVLADPPYGVSGAELHAVLEALTAHGWAAPGTVAVFERAVSAESVNWPERWAAWPPRRYGDTRLELAELS